MVGDRKKSYEYSSKKAKTVATMKEFHTISINTNIIQIDSIENKHMLNDNSFSSTPKNSLNIDQELKIYATSGSWGMGSGKFSNSPQSTDGASWEWRTFSGSAGTGAEKWQTTGQLKLGSILSMNTVTTTNVEIVANFSTYVTSQSGEGAVIRLTSSLVNGVPTITKAEVTDIGTDFAPGETITITRATLGTTAFGTSSGDLILTLDSTNIDLGKNATTS